MFCPKCGSTLSTGLRGNFECPQGLEFSIDLSRRLREHYPRTEAGSPVVRDKDGRLRWSCPGCGVERQGLTAPCAKCGASMSPGMVHSLIEFHPHPNGRGGHF
jgi:hypothetical protein